MKALFLVFCLGLVWGGCAAGAVRSGSVAPSTAPLVRSGSIPDPGRRPRIVELLVGHIQGTMGRCYGALRRERAGLGGGDVGFAGQIDAGGQLVDFELTTTGDIDDEGFRRCVTRSAAGWTFPAASAISAPPVPFRVEIGVADSLLPFPPPFSVPSRHDL